MEKKEAMKILKDFHDKSALFSVRTALDTIIPELRASEDEKIRKDCIKYLDWEYQHCPFDKDKMKIEKCIAWLEKQGEQEEPQVYEAEDGEIITYSETDGYRVVEPKFKVGDTMRTLQEAADGYTDGMPVVISVDKEYYHCTNELIAIKDQDDYEYPPMNRIQTPTDKVEPKFKVGDKIKLVREPKYPAREIIAIQNDAYYFDKLVFLLFRYQDEWELVEQNPVDKVEPRFKVGDCVVNNNSGGVYKVTEIGDDEYCLWPLDGRIMGYLRIIDVDNEYHLWTIQDAKDGDVLATLDYILVFKEFLKNDGGISYCHYDFGAGNPQFIWFEDKNWYFGKEAIIHPATQEQRDLLFQKMKEAGYTFDFYKKELKKIEKTPAWNEDDERMYKGLIKVIYDTQYCDSRKEFSEWLKSIKDRVGCEVNCSEQDEYNFAFIQEALLGLDGDDSYREKCCKMAEWLESLRPQNTWKPSDEQMQVLLSEVTAWTKGCPKQIVLESLYNDLKKLKG